MGVHRLTRLRLETNRPSHGRQGTVKSGCDQANGATLPLPATSVTYPLEWLTRLQLTSSSRMSCLTSQLTSPKWVLFILRSPSILCKDYGTGHILE